MFSHFLSIDNPKAIKAQKLGWLNGINYMAPHKLASTTERLINLCANASPACINLCLGKTSGNAALYPTVLRSRIAKAQWFMADRKAFMRAFIKAAARLERDAAAASLLPCLRPNGATDIPWEGIKAEDGRTIFEHFPAMQFVDYTKSLKRALLHAAGKMPANYHLTFSRSETNESDCLRVLEAGGNVAAVFAGPFPSTWHGFPVVNGDLSDLRHLDPKGVVVALSPKGRVAKADQSGFVIRG
jgi:hypothetical protein